MTQLEIDTLIATKIMGWQTMPNMALQDAYWRPRESRTGQILNGAMYLKRKELRGRRRDTYDDPADHAGDGFTFSPSTCEADAQKTLSEMMSKGYHVTVFYTPFEVTVEIAKPEWPGSSVEKGAAFPEALCLAAIDAIAV